MLLNLTIVAGDGIGPEVTGEAVRVLQTVADSFGHELKLTRKNIGGAGLAASNDPLPADTLEACLSSGAVLLGAVGSPAFTTKIRGICGRKQDCFACARNWARLRTCVRRNAFPPCSTIHHCDPRWCGVPTS